MGAAQSGLRLRPPKGGTGVRKWPAKSIGGMGFPKKVLPELPRNEAGLRVPNWAPYSEEPMLSPNRGSPAPSMKEELPHGFGGTVPYARADPRKGQTF